MMRYKSAAHGRLVPALCGLLLFSVAAGAADTKTADSDLMKVRMTSTVPGEGVESRTAAVAAAERDIIRQTLKATVNLEDMAPLDALVREPAPYIKSTQLIRCDTSKDAGTRVEIESYVKRKRLLEDAAAILLPQMAHPPVVLVLLAEQLSSAAGIDASKPGAAETALARAMKDAKLALADAAAVRAAYARPDLLAAIQTGEGTAAQLAAITGAQAVVLGEAIVTGGEEAGKGNVRAMRAGVTLRIYRGTDGSLLDSLSHEAQVQSYNPLEGGVGAIEDACAKLAKDAALYAVLAAAAPTREDELNITVYGGERADLDQMVQAFQLAGGSRVEEIFAGNGLARFRVHYEGNTAEFVEQVAAPRYTGFTIDPQQAVQRDLVFKVVR